MTSQTSDKKPLNRNTLYLVMAVCLIVVISAWSWEAYLGLALTVAGFAAAAYWVLRDRRGLGRYAISTECESCGALLQEHVGLPERVCSSCGRKQSWAKWA